MKFLILSTILCIVILQADVLLCHQTKSDFLKIQNFTFDTETLIKTNKLSSTSKKIFYSQYRKTSLSKNTYAILFTTWHYIKKRDVVSGVNYLTIKDGKYKLIVDSHTNDIVKSNISYGVCNNILLSKN